jgi:hypothetical protein
MGAQVEHPFKTPVYGAKPGCNVLGRNLLEK